MARILLIEDDPAQVALVRRWLPEHDLQVAADGCTAAVLGRGRWDLIISDMELPGPNGIQLAQGRGASGAPTLMITSHTQFGVAVDAMRAGVHDVLAKPFGRDQLVRAVERLLETKRHRRILAIGAHPDDVEIGVGGTLARHRAEGDQVTILTLSRGAAGGPALRRAYEAKHAAALLGAELILDDLPDTRLSCGPETIGAIEEAVRVVQPDIVYTHSPNDRHQDHRATFEATRIAARGVPNVYAYQSPSTTIDFRPTRFVDVGSWLDAKLAALSAYASQGERAYIQEMQIHSTAAYWGRFAQYSLVEPLEIEREALAA